MIRALLPLLLLFATACTTAGPLEVYAVRHAEKMSGPDPELTSKGRERALDLVERLAGEDLVAIHSTDTRRTRQTAAPIAQATGLEVEIYDGSDLDALVRTLRARGGTHLVVGHSNTTPDLVARLGGEPGEPIREADEYDRLYRVDTRGAGVSTELIRFGE